MSLVDKVKKYFTEEKGIMKTGKAFEIFVKRVLISVGFLEVKSDGLYVFDGSPGQMIQGLGEAHNADVLLEPPVQTPFFYKTRLLVECKDYSKKIGLNIVRGILGLREDINHFEMVDADELLARKSQRRRGIFDTYERCTCQVAIASFEGYTAQAQRFAATHRIPLIEFNKMVFWSDFQSVLQDISRNERLSESEKEEKITRFADDIGKRMAVAITNSGQILFLYRELGTKNYFSEDYNLYWVSHKLPWKLTSGNCQYVFQLPDCILEQWLNNVSNEIDKRKEALNCKEEYMSNMIVYYKENNRPTIKMISINRGRLEEAKRRL